MTLTTATKHPGDPAGVPGLRLEMSGVSKTFGQTAVLRGVGIEVVPGEIHALLGQNGSGKSTLIKVLSGLYRPDPGAVIRVDGLDVPQPITPVGISARGLTIIHQSLGLIPGHSVTENIRLGTLSRRRFGRFIDWKYETEQARSTLRAMKSDIDPDRLVDHLHVGQRATVAIARALQVVVPGTGCVVLDESTQSLSREVLPEFYGTIRGLAEQGTSILIVSHRLDEVLGLADRVTVLRDGAVTSTGVKTAGMSEAQLSREILGRQLVGFTRPEITPDEPPRVAAAAVSRPIVLTGVTGEVLQGIDFEIRPGEVLGVTGPTESGHEELPYLITGAATARAGTISVEGSVRTLRALTVTDSLTDGVVLVPNDRAGQGIAVGEQAMDNVTLPRVRERSKHGILRRGWQDREFADACAMLNISPPDPDLLAGSFSGGNQQKLLLAKWLLQHPRVLVLHEPTQAVDVGARADILRAISTAAADGAAVLLSSIEAQDLALVCDRVLILERGRIVRQLVQPFSPDDVLSTLP